MSIKKVQTKNGKQYCGYGGCKGKRVPATWRNWHHYLPHPYACDAHVHDLDVAEDNHMSLADEMTWGRL